MTAIKMILAAFGAILLYALSAGPVFRYTAKYPAPAPVRDAFYAPLALVYNNTILQVPMEWYLGLWGVK